MIDINRETGTVTWDGFTLHPQLTHDEFVQQYPLIKPKHDIMLFSGIQRRIYDLTPIKIDNYALIPQAIYDNSILDSLSFTRDDDEYSEDDLGMPELAHWGKNIHHWLTVQFGEPHKTRPASFFDEDDFLTPEEIPYLETWTYNFKWGSVGFHYDCVRTVAYIFIHYDYHKQVDTWEKLAQECDLRIQKDQEINGKLLGHLVMIRALIDPLSPLFDYQTVKPMIADGKIHFSLNNNTRRVAIHVFPENSIIKYKLRRHDTAKELFIADDYSQLIDTLRLFFEAETL